MRERREREETRERERERQRKRAAKDPPEKKEIWNLVAEGTWLLRDLEQVRVCEDFLEKENWRRHVTAAEAALGGSGVVGSPGRSGEKSLSGGGFYGGGSGVCCLVL